MELTLMNQAFHSVAPLIEELEARFQLSAGPSAGQLVGAPALARSTATLSGPRWLLAGAAQDGKAVFAGGDGPGFANESAVDIYDSLSGQWSTGSLSHARGELAATSAGGQVIFAGGQVNAVPDRSDVADLYDPKTGQWTTGKLSAPRSAFAATSVGGKALFVGDGAEGSRTVDIYDSSTGQWSTDILPHTSHAVVGTSVGDRAIFVGGAADVYDGATGRWSTAPLPEGEFFRAATTVGSKALFASDTGVVVLYDNVSGRWQVAKHSLGRQGVAATSVGTKAIFAGGYHYGRHGQRIESDAVDVYDSATGAWSTATLSQARDGAAAASAGTRAIVAGGQLQYAAPTATVDVFTDGAPAASLDGSIGLASTRSLNVRLRNRGDAALGGPIDVVVYGSRAGRKSTILGTANVRKALRAGASLDLDVALSLPKGASPAEYRFVAAAAAAGTGGAPLGFASRDDAVKPTARLVSAPTLRSTRKSLSFVVSYHDARKIDLATLGETDLLVTGPRGFSAHPRLVGVTRGRHASTRVAVYAVDGPGRRWDSGDNGVYTIHLGAGEVADMAGNAVVPNNLGSFRVNIAEAAIATSVKAVHARFQITRKVGGLLD
jgi:hypothetical protein